MLQNSDIISLNLLFNLENVDVSGELFDLSTTYGVNQASLTDTVAPNETVFLSLDESELRVLQKCLAANNDIDASDKDISFESLAFVVSALRFRDTLFVAHKLSYLLIQSVFGLSLSLGSLLSEFTRLKLTVLIGLASVNASERV